MVPLESAMNIEEMFERYNERKSYVIKFEHSFIDIILTEIANSNICLRIIYRSDYVSYYKIFMYSKSKSTAHYTYIDEEMIEGKEMMMNHARENHPELLNGLSGI